MWKQTCQAKSIFMLTSETHSLLQTHIKMPSFVLAALYLLDFLGEFGMDFLPLCWNIKDKRERKIKLNVDIPILWIKTKEWYDVNITGYQQSRSKL